MERMEPCISRVDEHANLSGPQIKLVHSPCPATSTACETSTLPSHHSTLINANIASRLCIFFRLTYDSNPSHIGENPMSRVSSAAVSSLQRALDIVLAQVSCLVSFWESDFLLWCYDFAICRNSTCTFSASIPDVATYERSAKAAQVGMAWTWIPASTQDTTIHRKVSP